jgi:predicted MPP superfamily phosphohydrolase
VNRRRFLGAAAALGAGALGVDAAWWEPRSLDVTHHRLPLPPGRPPLRFVQISDLHLRGIGALHRRVAAETARARPDFALLTGDSVDQADALPALDAFLALLDPRLPKYAVLGNWEHWSGVDLRALAAIYERHNARLLVNESAVHSHPSGPVAITGLDDLVGAPDCARPCAPPIRRRAPPPGSLPRLPRHPSPRTRRRRAPSRASPWMSPPSRSCCRAIRTVGRSPWVAGRRSFRRGAAATCAAGSAATARRPLYVSRGIGTSVLPIRFGATPELAVFTG